jgi:hypothetical protein
LAHRRPDHVGEWKVAEAQTDVSTKGLRTTRNGSLMRPVSKRYSSFRVTIGETSTGLSSMSLRARGGMRSGRPAYSQATT